MLTPGCPIDFLWGFRMRSKAPTPNPRPFRTVLPVWLLPHWWDTRARWYPPQLTCWLQIAPWCRVKPKRLAPLILRVPTRWPHTHAWAVARHHPHAIFITRSLVWLSHGYLECMLHITQRSFQTMFCARVTKLPALSHSKALSRRLQSVYHKKQCKRNPNRILLPKSIKVNFVFTLKMDTFLSLELRAGELSYLKSVLFIFIQRVSLFSKCQAESPKRLSVI